MQKSTQEKSMVKVNENNIIYRIKSFILRVLGKNKVNKNNITIEHDTNIKEKNTENENSFIESLKNIESEETKLSKLQKEYRDGKIKEEELSEEQIKSLCAFYDMQIANLKNSNETRKKKLLEYRNKNKLQTDN